ncbi:YfeC-like transcriptional regulator [Tatumella sp. OPLPL6]|uniref:YfeC-like transcriptional regulator n=1 Tax=Tatumella sp. OPLPL6 TaxID=1928657 RepID=UPI000C19E9BD|nr:YfeC-like transcriptional regulator [Tatumella sp. OPLPL6]PIJ42466.1 hypothetical protein BOM24_11455 [Tatumella sp. OPLPL6]
MNKEWMTPEELAQETGYSRQTINKWIKREGWATVAKPGVQGGKARLVHIDQQVTEFLKSVRHAAEPRSHYTVRKDQLTQILLSSVQQMSPDEKAQLTSLLLREGISGILSRLGITS